MPDDCERALDGSAEPSKTSHAARRADALVVVAMIEVALALHAPSFEIFHAVADYQGAPLPPSRATRFGYRCARPGNYEAALRKLQAWWHSDEMARTRRGASFAAGPLDE